jgi:transposase
MEHFIGIDVAKDRLDVHIRPNGESFTLARNGEALAALVASRANPVIAPYYAKLRAAGKTGKQALVACMRKLLVILNAILRDHKPWQPA